MEAEQRQGIVPSAAPAQPAEKPYPADPHASSAIEEDSVDLLKLLAILSAEWRLGLLTMALVFFAGAAYTYLITPLYESTASIVPHGAREDSNSLASLVSGRAGPGELYIGLLKSQAVADSVVDDLGLMQVYRLQSHIDARRQLLNSMTFKNGPDTIITITARSKDAALAMKIANGFVDGLQRQGETMELKQAAEHQKLFELQLNQEREILAQAETDLRDIEQKTGIVQAESQTQAGLAAIANVRSQITALQVQLAGLLQGATESNPQVQTLNSEIHRLQSQEAVLESSSSGRAGAPSAAGSAPAINLEVARKQREVRYHEALLTSLSNRYQSERLADVSAGLAFNVVDTAETPEKKAWPPRRIFLLFAALAAFLLGLFAMIGAILARRLWADPLEREYLQQVRNNFRPRS